MRSVTMFMEGLQGDLGTDAHLSSNKFDGVNQAQTSGKFNPDEVKPSYPEAPKPNPQDPSVHWQQPRNTTMNREPSTIDKQTRDSQQQYSKRKKNQAINQTGSIVSRIYTHKMDKQGTHEGDDIKKRLSK